jgi:hypothetical protein
MICGGFGGGTGRGAADSARREPDPGPSQEEPGAGGTCGAGLFFARLLRP